MNKLDKMTLKKDKMILKLVEDDEIKIEFNEEGEAETYLRHWKSRKWKKLRNTEEKAGYIEHIINRHSKKIKIRQHRLAWIYVHRQIPPPGAVIHHKDENKQNNHIGNLELKSKQAHLVHSGKYPNQKIAGKLKSELIREYIKIAGKKGRNRNGEVQELADRYGIHRTHLARIIRKYRKEQQAV